MTDTIALPKPITLAEAMGHAEAIIAEFGPSYVYNREDEETCLGSGNGCFYVRDGEPDCIVAKVLHRHGVPFEVLEQWEGFNAIEMGPTGSVRDGVTTPTQPLATAEATRFLADLQRLQDVGEAWGSAYDRAKRAVRLYG